MEWVSPQRLRQRFNNGLYYERVTAGTLRARTRLSRLAPQSAGQAPGTVSQFVEYFDGRQKVAQIHQYLRPDGTIGASGRPDPKGVFENGRWYRTKP